VLARSIFLAWFPGAGMSVRPSRPELDGCRLRATRLPRSCVAVALVGVAVLSGCGRSGPAAQGGAGAGTSVASAVVALVAPTDGADTVIGSQLASFAQTVRSKVLGDCMTSDGFSAPNFPIGIGPPSDLGNPQFPNLPVIEATHDLGLFTGGGVPFFDPQSGMSAPERQAWQRRIMHCFNATQRQDPLFGAGQFGQLSSGWFNIVNQVSQSSQLRALSRTAATCSAAHGVPASSVMSLYGRLQGQIGPLSPSTDGTEIQAIQAKGANILATCWAQVINETTSLLSARRATYLAQNATALAAMQSRVDRQVASLERQYGVKLKLGAS
jgi:hypothetical protein